MISPETRVMGLPYGEEIMIVGRTMWTQCTSVTDGQTDRQNYGHKDRATHSIAQQKLGDMRLLARNSVILLLAIFLTL